MEFNDEEYFKRNSELGIEFSKYVLEHPELDDLLSEEKIVILLPEFDPELRSFNLKLGEQIEEEGGKVLYINIKSLATKIPSRLIGVEVQAA